MEIQIPAEPMALMQRLNRGGYEAYVVGGCVRDALMGTRPHDWDICTNALPEQVLDLFHDHRVAKTGLQHGTVMVVRQGVGYEITTFRTDGVYSDHRHPDQVSFVPSLDQDLARRDFTVNAMAYHPDTGVVDLFGGREDLKQGVIRCVGQAEERFEEDGLRLMRALRFASRFGFRLEEDTASAIHRRLELLDSIAAERIFSELKGFLCGKGVEALLVDYRDVFARILPQLAPMFDFPQQNPHHCFDVWRHTARAVRETPAQPALRIAALFHDSGKPECWSRDGQGIDHFYGHAQRSVELSRDMLNRLRCDNETKEQVLLQVKWHDLPLPQTRREAARLLNRMGEQGAQWSVALHRADALAQSPAFLAEKLERVELAKALLEELLREKACFTLKDLAIGGSDLIALGVPKGPQVGKTLKHLLELVMDGACPNQREALLERCRQEGINKA